MKIFVIIPNNGPLRSALIRAWPASLFKSPLHIFGILYCCEIPGCGICWTTILSSASSNGRFSLNHFLSSCWYFSNTTAGVRPFCCKISTVKAQPSLADPTATELSLKVTLHLSLNSFGHTFLTKLLTWFAITSNLPNTSSGFNLNSEIKRSALFMNNTGLHASSPTANCIFVSVWVIIPSKASTSMIAPSEPLSALDTSPVNDKWPGVSLIWNKYCSFVSLPSESIFVYS